MTDSTPVFGRPGSPTPTASGRTESTSRSQRVVWGRRAFTVLAWIFAACVAIQVFIAGMAVFVGPTWWGNHIAFVHLFEYIPILLLIAAFVGSMSAKIKWLSLAAVLLIALQYATIEIAKSSAMPELAALHPVNALLIFWLAIWLATGRSSNA